MGKNWFLQGLVRPGHAVTKISYPGERGVGHQWAYLPDVARMMVELLAHRESLDPFARFHMGGHWDEDGTRIAAAIRRVVARRTEREPAIAGFPWWLLTLMSPFNVTFREMKEMRYLWRTPVHLNDARLVDTIGPRTAHAARRSRRSDAHRAALSLRTGLRLRYRASLPATCR